LLYRRTAIICAIRERKAEKGAEGVMRSLPKLPALGAALIIAAICSTAAPAVDKDQVIKDRQTFMKDQGRQWLVLRNYVQGKADEAAAISAVASLTKSVPKVPDHFPPDTGGPAPGGKWGTKPEVWSEHDKFLAADRKVADQVAELDAAVKSGDKAKTAAAFKDLNACAACHQDFRAKLQ
jgi:cytochrome c556